MGEAKTKREKPCHCGSGLAYVKCCMSRDHSNRTQGFVFSVKESSLITGLQISSDGRVELLSGDSVVSMEDVRPTEWRETTKGLKAKSQAFTSQTGYVSPEAAIAGADYVFGIDTNTLSKEGRSVHVSCLTCATTQIAQEYFEGSIQQILCVDFQDAECHPERVGWLIAIEAILRSLPHAGADIVLVTDHDLNSLGKINLRQEPVALDRFLPPGFRMVYAADKGTAMPNKLIKAAHTGATKVAKLVLSEDIPGQNVLPLLLNGKEAHGMRRWINDKNSSQFFS